MPLPRGTMGWSVICNYAERKMKNNYKKDGDDDDDDDDDVDDDGSAKKLDFCPTLYWLQPETWFCSYNEYSSLSKILASSGQILKQGHQIENNV